jgi:hypothetical protein
VVSSIQQRCLVVVSYYDRHPINNLTQLLASLVKHRAGEEFDICIVVNRTKDQSISLPDEYSWVPIDYRHNVGMNIGAWDHGWRTHPGYRDYLFLQDECFVIRGYWLIGFRASLENSQIGMVGESLNKSWDRTWFELKRMFDQSLMPGHYIDGKVAHRVDCYLHFLKEHGVQPGNTARHLRSLIWFFPASVLQQIDGFLIGRNYGECIAAEIAASKKVESLGLKIAQTKEEEFFYIRHLEYNQDWPGGPYTHDVNYVAYASVRRLFEETDRDFWKWFQLKLKKYFGSGPIKLKFLKRIDVKEENDR